MSSPHTYERNGQTYTITIEPSPFNGSVFQYEDIDATITVKVAYKSALPIYTGTISSSLASHIEATYKTTIADFLVSAAKTIVDARCK